MAGELNEVALAKIGAVLRGHVDRGEMAGAVALVAWPGGVHVEAVGVQDLAAGTPMRRDTIFRLASMTKPIVAAMAMLLVDDGRIALDDPVERWLPELADRRVLRSPDGALDDTLPARRPITLDDLLTFRLGLGAVMAPPGSTPLQSAMERLGVAPGRTCCRSGQTTSWPASAACRSPPARRRWIYHTGIDVLALQIARVTGAPLERFSANGSSPRSGCATPATVSPRLARPARDLLRRDEQGGLQVWDAARGSRFARPPAFPDALVSTADDYLALRTHAANEGTTPAGLLRRGPCRLMMSATT